MSALRAAVPLYHYPGEDSGLWEQVLTPGAVDLVVVNVDSGPGAELDPVFTEALRCAPDNVHGYVDTDYGRRPVDDIRADAHRWRAWYGVRSIFLDQVVSGAGAGGRVDTGSLARLTGLVGALRRDGMRSISGNPGTVPHPQVLRLFDVTCVRETDMETHLSTPIAPLPEVAASSLWHLVYDCPPDRLEEVLARSVELGAGLVGVTPDGLPHPWGSVGYLNNSAPQVSSCD
ncbi:spherulation-specific family 4 protein [Rhodococcus sp. IEGM 1408]|uniref:spherulation-specific family 4 protein n=1 Tax=Rhodococcus sp. IEGM 1408 TaxID=3082220 RepID=UPI002953BA4F|nr:spherulation-specific family 4 protein [Rhodococcus sp. IEGM 1408]MDV8000109.1 spherulation-specific family 4 protein [Rhodococcus sp. IEGM 1408]